MGPLVLAILAVCPNACLGHTRVARALLECHGSRPCLMASRGPELESGRISEKLRITMGMMRDLKNNPEQLAATIRKVQTCRHRHQCTGNNHRM